MKQPTAWLISGGLGSLGLLSTLWLLSRNTKQICLLGRSGRTAESETLSLANVSMIHEETTITATR